MLLRLGRLWADDELERRAVSVFRLVEPAIRRAPGAFAWALCGLDLWLSPPREIAIVGHVDSPVARAALAPFQPSAVVAVGPSDEVPLLAGKGLVDGKPAVYVCERFVCQRACNRAGGATEGMSDDRGAGGCHLGRLGAARHAHRSPRARGALPLGSLHGDHPAAGRRPRRLGDACRPGCGHEADPARHARLTGDVSPSERPRANGGNRRPHLGRAGRGRDGLRLVRAGARGERLPVPRREGRASSSSPSRSRSSCAPSPRSGFDHRGPAYRLEGQPALPEPRPGAASADRPRWEREAAVCGARRSVRHRGQHARRSRRRASRAQAASRQRLRGRRTRPGLARVLRDDRVLRGRGSARRCSIGFGASSLSGRTTPTRRRSSRSGATAGSSARSKR